MQSEHNRLSAIVENPSSDLQSTRAAIEKQLAEIEKASRSELEAIREAREVLRKEQHKSLVPKEIEQQLEGVESRRRLLTEERDRKTAEAEDSARKAREMWLRAKTMARKANDVDGELEATKKLNAASSRTQSARIENEYRKKLGDVEAEVKKLVDRRAELVEANEEAIRPRLDELAHAEQRVNAEYGKTRAALRTQLGSVHRDETGNLKTIEETARQRDALAKLLRAKEAEFRRIASDSQLHRIAPPFARWWTGEDYEPHTIPETYVKTVAVVWFGSMAMLGALGGSAIAMVSQLLWKRASKLGLPDEFPGSAAEVIAAKQKFWTSLRRMLVRRKFARVRTRTVEVVRVETQTKVVAVPVPINASFHDFKREYAELSASLPSSGVMDKPASDKPGPTNEPTGNH